MTTVNGFQLIATTQFWNIWVPPSFYTANQRYFTPEKIAYPDLYVSQIAKDFGYTIFPLSGGNYDGVHLDLVLDSDGAHTSTVFGGNGATIAADSIYNVVNGQEAFWFHILSLHETINVWTGSIAHDWVWADGSSFWAGQSPFPNMCDVVITGEIGYQSVSSLQASRFASDAGVQLFLNIQAHHGWRVFQSLFATTKKLNITEWSVHPEPMRTAILAWFLSFPVGTSLLTQFNSATQAISGQTVPLSTYQQAQAMFPF